MQIHHTVLCALFLFASACQSGPAPQQSGKVIDSLVPDTIAAIGGPVSKEDSVEMEIKEPEVESSDSSAASSWQIAGFDDPEGFKRFYVRFREWVRTDNVDSVIAYMDFPLRTRYKTADQVRKRYSQIFDKDLKAAIAQQQLHRIFRNYQGAMVADGAIWFAQVENKGYRIIAINK